MDGSPSVGERDGGKADRDDQKKDSPPIDHFDDEAAEGRAEKKAEMMGRGHESLGLPFRSLRDGFQGEGPARRLDHRSSQSLKETKDDHLENVLGDPAQEGAGRDQAHAEAVDLSMTVDVPQPAEDDAAADPGDLK